MHILVADDDEVFVQILSESLNEKGYETTQALNYEDVLPVFTQNIADYVLLDLMMNNQSTMPLIPLLMAQQPTCKIIVLTGYASVASTVQALKLGASNYLAKPVGIKEIMHVLTDERIDAETEMQPIPLNRVEWEHIQRILAENHGNISATARALKVHRRTLQRKLDKRPPKE